MNVSAIIVTRGDVDLRSILESIPQDWQVIVWDNGAGNVLERAKTPSRLMTLDDDIRDLAVYGRYAAIEYTSSELIYVQDDDVLHKPEGIHEIVNRYYDALGREWDHIFGGGVVCNMPANFRHSFYQEHALVGFGAVFHRDLPFKAFRRIPRGQFFFDQRHWFYRACDIVFTALTPRVLVDVPYEDLPWASAPNRMWQQPSHRKERGDMLDLVLKVRDG